MAAYRHTRSAEDPDVDFPVFDPGEWSKSGHLPITSEVIGAIRHTTGIKVSAKQACYKVAQMLINHWSIRNVYTKTEYNVQNQLDTMYKEFQLIRKIFMKKGKPSQPSLERYLKFKESKEKVFDISTEDKERIKVLEEKFGVKMSKSEQEYLESQKNSQILRTDAKATDLDPSWVTQEKKKDKLMKYQEKQKKRLMRF